MDLKVSTVDKNTFYIKPGSAQLCEYFSDWSTTTHLQLPPQPFLTGSVVAAVVEFLDHCSTESEVPPVKPPQPLSSRVDLYNLLTEWEKEVFLPSLKPVRRLASVLQCADYLGIPRLVTITAATLAWHFHVNPASLREPQLFLET